MRGNNFFHVVLCGMAVIPKDYNASATPGETISEPWKKGQQIAFLLVGGAHAASSTMSCVVQVQKRSDSSWVALEGKDGTTDVVFTPSKLADAGQIENGVVLGTIPLSKVDGDTYKAIRLLPTGSAHAQIFGAAYIIYDLKRRPSGQVDDLFAQVAP